MLKKEALKYMINATPEEQVYMAEKRLLAVFYILLPRLYKIPICAISFRRNENPAGSRVSR